MTLYYSVDNMSDRSLGPRLLSGWEGRTDGRTDGFCEREKNNININFKLH